MAIPTSRTKTKAEIRVDEAKCKGCGLCVSVCKDFSLIIEDQKAKEADNPIFGCVGCGHCMAICPSGAISIHGRTLSPDDLFDLPDANEAATYEQLHSLFQRRRSIREFTDTPIADELITKILEAASTAPMGLPPSDTSVLVFDSQEKVRGFAKDFCSYLEDMKWLVSDWFLFLMRPFWGKANDEMFRGFVKPMFNIDLPQVLGPLLELV
jgi:ferredoxin